MLLRKFFLFGLLVALSYSPVLAQLGPKDGPNQPPTDLDRIKVGQPAPDFTLENIEGTKISLSDYRGKKRVVLVFYRGHW